MSGGSVEPEGAHDRQCDSCGLYYRDQGVSFQMHQSACDGESGATEQPTEEVEETSPSPDTSPQEASDTPTETVDESPSEESSNPALDSPATSEPTGGATPEASTYDPEDGCPNCDGELIDFRSKDTITRGGRMYDTPDEYYCSNCGRGWNDE